jgi:hypothetical protein
MSLSRQVVRAVAFLGAAGAIAGCGGSDSSTGPTSGGGSKTLTAAEAQQVSAALFTEISKAFATATVTTSDLGPTASLAAAPTTVKETVKGNCTNGGTITGNATVTIDFNTAGTSGTEAMTMTITAAGCKVNTGSQVIAIDGNLNYSFSATVTNGQITSPYTWHGTGNWSWSGGGSCSMDYSVSYNPTTGKGTETGTFCGTSINATF